MLLPRFGSPAYWLGTVLPVVVASGTVGAASLLTVFALDAERNLALLARAMGLCVLALVVGTVLGLCAAVGALLMSDPYLVANVATSLWVLLVGVVAPLSAHPAHWGAVGHWLPMAHSVGVLRGERWASIGGEFLTLAPWCAALVLLVALARRRLTSGRDFSYL